jgi:hypothetical protein
MDNLFQSLFTYSAGAPISENNGTLHMQPDFLMNELNLGGDILGNFELRRQIYDGRSTLLGAVGDSNVPEESSEHEKCRDIEKAVQDGRALLSQHIKTYQACHAQLAALDKACDGVEALFAHANRAIRELETACLKHDHSADVVGAVADAVQNLAGARDAAVRAVGAKRPELERAFNESCSVLRRLSATYQGLRTTHNSMFTCPICLDRQVDKYVMTCGHTFCHACVQDIDDHCPMCRRPIVRVGDLYFT